MNRPLISMKAGAACALVLALAGGAASALDVRDNARMFSAKAIEQANERLSKLESETRVPARIETIESLGGQSLDELTLANAQRWNKPGLYVLISQKEHKIETMPFRQFLNATRRRSIESAFGRGVNEGGVDKGLQALTSAIVENVEAVGPPPVVQRTNPRGNNRQAAPAPSGRPSYVPILIILALVVVGVLVLGRVFSGARRMPNGPGPGMPGAPMQPGYGPGYGSPQRPGGFWSGMLGGLGGAMAGNWIYDQMSGRRHQGSDFSRPDQGATDQPAPTDDWAPGDGGMSWGNDAGGGGGTDWGGGGGGGDWGGGDGGGSW